MDKNISTPWAVAAIVAVLVILGVVVWRGMAPKAPVASSAPAYYGPGGHRGPPPIPLSPGQR
jgi:hypothetical protein